MELRKVGRREEVKVDFAKQRSHLFQLYFLDGACLLCEADLKFLGSSASTSGGPDLHGILVCFSVSVIKHSDPKQFRGGEGLFGHDPSQREFRTGT